MWDKFVGEQIRRSNRNLLITNLVILLIFGSLLLSEHKTISGYLRGGEKTEVTALASMTPAEKTIVEVNADTVIPTGYRMVKHRSSGDEVEAEFLAMKAGDRLLIVKAEPNQKGPQFTGAIVPLPNDISSALTREIKSDRVRQAIMPVMLDTMEYKENTQVLLIFGIPAVLIGLWNLKKWMQRAADPATSPIVTQLEHRGGVMACQQVDMEMAQTSGKVGKALLTRSWILVPHTFGMHLVNFDDVVWVYKKVTRHRVNFVPVGKTYTVVLCSTTGKSVEVLDSEAKVNELLMSVATKAPWAITGFTTEAETLWRKNRDAMIQAVNQRRSAVMKKMAQAAATSSAPAPQPA